MAVSNWLIVGLGNYTYPLTRHSIAQLTLENLHHLMNHFHRSGCNPAGTQFIDKQGLSDTNQIDIKSTQARADLAAHMRLSKIDTAWVAKHSFSISKTTSEARPVTEERVLHLLKPRALMNISGPVVRAYHAKLSRTGDPLKLIILHDELDLSPLSVRLKTPPQSWKPKGHNGLKSVFAALSQRSSAELFTIGIGIGRDPDSSSKDSDAVGRWVLSPLNRNEIAACSWDLDAHSTAEPGKCLAETWRKILEIL